MRASFVPPRPQRDLRNPPQTRAVLADDHTRTINRLHKLLPETNLKLTSAATEILGASGRDLLAHHVN